MIQFKRGKTREWIAKMGTMDKLAPGQPGYDTDRGKIKIGDGKKTWSELKYVGGLDADEILDSEENAKKRFNTFDKLIAGLANLIGLDFSNDKVAVITYGKERPDKNTVGQLYLQHYESEPEVDYVVEQAYNGIWYYRKWYSGRAECYGTYTVNTAVCEEMSNIALFTNNTSIDAIPYPFKFSKTPTESASLMSDGAFVWLSTNENNTAEHSARYSLLTCIQKQQQAAYSITMHVTGVWR